MRADAQVRALGQTDLLRNLRFAEARRRLERAKRDCATPKDRLRLESAVTMIGFMEDVHTILRHNLAGYVFARAMCGRRPGSRPTDAASRRPCSRTSRSKRGRNGESGAFLL